LADQIAIIRRGKIIARGSIAALKQRLLGAVEYEVRFAAALNESEIFIPPGGKLTGQGEDWLRYHADRPNEFNPLMLRSLTEQNLPVFSLQEVPRSLEAVYIQAVNAPDDEVLDVR
jgi:ABC-type multidrug transport system ATPase subunit